MVGCFKGFWNPTRPRGHLVVVYNVADPANVFKDSLCKNSMISPKHSRDALAVWSFMNIIQVMGQVLLEKSWAIIEKKLETLQVPRKIPGPLITRLTMLLGQFSSVFVGRPCLRSRYCSCDFYIFTHFPIMVPILLFLSVCSPLVQLSEAFSCNRRVTKIFS